MNALLQLKSMNMLQSIRECEIEKRPMVFNGLGEMTSTPIFPFPVLQSGVAPEWSRIDGEEHIIPHDNGGPLSCGPVIEWARDVYAKHGEGVGFAVPSYGEETILLQAYRQVSH